MSRHDSEIEVTAVAWCDTCDGPMFDLDDAEYCTRFEHEIRWADTEHGADEVCYSILRACDRKKSLDRDLCALRGYLRQVDHHMVAGNTDEAKKILWAIHAANRGFIRTGGLAERVQDFLGSSVEVAS